MIKTFNHYRSHIREGFLLSFPVILSQLGHVMMGVTDSIMVGHVDTTSLAAVSLATVAFNVLMLFGIGVSYAITPLVASYHGEGDNDNIRETFRHGLVINVINGLLLVVAVLLFKNILYHIDQPEEVVALAIPFLTILAFSLLPVLIFQTVRQFVEGMGHTKIAMVIMIVSNVINIFLNYIFIYGHLGFPAMGLVGSGWATLISRIIMVLLIIAIVFYSSHFASFTGLYKIGNYSKVLFKKMLHIGIPAGVQFIFEVAAFDFSAVMMGWLGTQTLAAHQIAINLATVSYMATSGFAAAATIRVGYFMGKKDFQNVRMAANSLLGMAIILMGLAAIVFIACRYAMPAWYVADIDVINIAAPLLIIAGFFQLSDGIQVVCIGALRGIRDVKIPSVLIFVAYWIIGLPLGYWLGFKLGWGANGIWIGLLIGLTLTAIAMLVRFKRLFSKLS
jgi:MATE family multidrug resistance protein